MSKDNSLHVWLEASYRLFAEEGPEGIQVERLARMLQLNKSGFYHYFGDRDTHIKMLMEKHLNVAKEMAMDLEKIRQFDPEFMNFLIKYATPVMLHNQLIQHRSNKLLYQAYLSVNGVVDPLVIKLFADFIGFKDHLEFSEQYYHQVRDMFYSQISFERLNYLFLKDFLYQAREVILQAAAISSQKTES